MLELVSRSSPTPGGGGAVAILVRAVDETDVKKAKIAIASGMYSVINILIHPQVKTSGMQGQINTLRHQLVGIHGQTSHLCYLAVVSFIANPHPIYPWRGNTSLSYNVCFSFGSCLCV